MRIFKGFFLKFINSLPPQIKWSIFTSPFFRKKLRVEFSETRRKILRYPSKIIVIGANDGISFDDLISDIHPSNTEGVFVEPSRRYFFELNKNFRGFPNLKLLNMAITNDESVFTLYQLNDSGLKKMPEWGKGLGSLYRDHLLKFDLVTEQDIEEEVVSGKPFNWLVNEFNFESVDYLQIDTEGYDAEIIKMIDFENFSTRILKFEIANLERPDISEVMSILDKNGFILVRMKGDMVAYSKKVNPIFY